MSEPSLCAPDASGDTARAGCHGPANDDVSGLPLVAVVGSPNVGKSVLFHRMTHRYVAVSNYPGTTVELTRGRVGHGAGAFGVVDTPGLYSLLPVGDDERVARHILLHEPVRAVVHVADAKNLQRSVALTVQLADLGRPVVLVLNMMDEAERLGIDIDAEGLSAALGVPVVPVVATTGRGLPRLQQVLARELARPSSPPAPMPYDEPVERAVREVARLLPDRFAAAARAVALLLLQGDAGLLEELGAGTPAAAAAERARAELYAAGGHTVALRLALQRQEHAREVCAAHVREPVRSRRSVADWVGALAVHPVAGIPILLAILYFGLYQFVGVFGAGEVVDFLENRLFAGIVSPWVDGLLSAALPAAEGWQYWLRELVGGEYGVVTLGLSYAVAIILPIVGLFFLFFSALEDSGYLPRLAMLADRACRLVGLNGRAVIPLVLGFGCDTMATMVTRVQETRRERLITTFLLALAIPCSAQYGVITGLLAGAGAGVLGVSYAFVGWAAVVGLLFLVAGALAAQVLPGQRAHFYMELPPMRWPRPHNVLAKTLARMHWYFLEVLPLFLLASVLIWVGRLTGLFDVALAALAPLMGLLGLPQAAATAFLYGFFRRDFGAAGLFALAAGGGLTAAQLLVAAVTLTLFVPCVAQFLIMKKERGLRAAVAIGAVAFVTAFAVGAGLHQGLLLVGVA